MCCLYFQVFECCSSLLKSDEDKEVRKAAGQAITLLLQGMSGDSFKASCVVSAFISSSLLLIGPGLKNPLS